MNRNDFVSSDVERKVVASSSQRHFDTVHSAQVNLDECLGQNFFSEGIVESSILLLDCHHATGITRVSVSECKVPNDDVISSISLCLLSLAVAWTESPSCFPVGPEPVISQFDLSSSSSLVAM
jgi:hypothetical protein